MIYALNFTGKRDRRLSDLMVKTLKKYCPNLGGVEITFTTGKKFMFYRGGTTLTACEYGNGAGWGPSMAKVSALRKIVKKYNPGLQDFILSVDSDVVFCNSKVFDYIKSEYGIIGIGHNGEKANTFIGKLNHMSGCSIYLRGDVAREIADMTEARLDRHHQHFKMYNIAENEDVVLSYLAQSVGAVPFSFPVELHSGDFETDLQNGNLSSFYHINYCPTSFLGMKVSGKWDIPEVLNRKNIKL